MNWRCLFALQLDVFKILNPWTCTQLFVFEFYLGCALHLIKLTARNHLRRSGRSICRRKNFTTRSKQLIACLVWCFELEFIGICRNINFGRKVLCSDWWRYDKGSEWFTKFLTYCRFPLNPPLFLMTPSTSYLQVNSLFLSQDRWQGSKCSKFRRITSGKVHLKKIVFIISPVSSVFYVHDVMWLCAASVVVFLCVKFSVMLCIRARGTKRKVLQNFSPVLHWTYISVKTVHSLQFSLIAHSIGLRVPLNVTEL